MPISLSLVNLLAIKLECVLLALWFVDSYLPLIELCLGNGNQWSRRTIVPSKTRFTVLVVF